METIKIYVEPRYMRLASLWAGIIFGFAIVALDPLLRFPDIPTRINWREGIITALLVGGYGFTLALLITSFWRQRRMLWLSVLMTAPIIAVFIAIWNDLTTAFGTPSNILAILPVTFLVHALMTGLVLLYLEMALRLSIQRAMALTAIPVVLFILCFMVLGRLRWDSQDAKDVMYAVNNYASQTIEGDYAIEYQGIRYNSGLASIGQARIYTNDGTLQCEARIFQNVIDVNCEES